MNTQLILSNTISIVSIASFLFFSFQFVLGKLNWSKSMFDGNESQEFSELIEQINDGQIKYLNIDPIDFPPNVITRSKDSQTVVEHVNNDSGASQITPPSMDDLRGIARQLGVKSWNNSKIKRETLLKRISEAGGVV